VSPWENHFFGWDSLFLAEIAVYTNLQWAKTGARARGPCRRRCVDIPAELTGARHAERCTWGEPTRPGVGSLSRKRYTQCVKQNRTGHCGNKSETERGPIMREVLCAIALKTSNGRQTHHTQHDLPTEVFLTCYFSARSPERQPLGCM
jgi:hypothetical protein